MPPTDDEYELAGERPKWHLAAAVAVPTVLVVGGVIVATSGGDGDDVAELASTATTTSQPDPFGGTRNDPFEPTAGSNGTVTLDASDAASADSPTTASDSTPAETGDSVATETTTTVADLEPPADPSTDSTVTSDPVAPTTISPTTTTPETTAPATTVPPTTAPPVVVLGIEVDIGTGEQPITSMSERAVWERDAIELDFVDAETFDLAPPAGLRLEVRSTELTGAVDLPWPAESESRAWLVEPYIELTDVMVTVIPLEVDPGGAGPWCFSGTDVCLSDDT